MECAMLRAKASILAMDRKLDRLPGEQAFEQGIEAA